MKTLADVAMLVAVVFTTGELSAAPIVERGGVWFDSTNGSASFTVFQQPATTGFRDYTGISFDFDGRNLQVEFFLTDESSDWYLVQPGQAFGRDTIAAGLFPPLSEPLKYPHPTPSYRIPAGEFYLGFSTGKGFKFPDDRTIYGWVKLVREGEDFFPYYDVLLMLDNATSYDSPGIIVGTTTVVPEPTGLVLAIGLGLGVLRFRPSRRQRV